MCIIINRLLKSIYIVMKTAVLMNLKGLSRILVDPERFGDLNVTPQNLLVIFEML